MTDANPSRRQMLKTTAAFSAAAIVAGCSGSSKESEKKAPIAAVAATLPATLPAHVAGSHVIKVGLVGCGGRGTGAANDIVTAAGKDVKIVALGDVFRDRIDTARAKFADSMKDNLDLADERCFVGFDAYQKVIHCGVDLVIFATPPGFRATHIRAAADAGKHIFAEKPVAVDPVGARSVME